MYCHTNFIPNFDMLSYFYALAPINFFPTPRRQANYGNCVARCVINTVHTTFTFLTPARHFLGSLITRHFYDFPTATTSDSDSS